jgi:hypothetical protein
MTRRPEARQVDALCAQLRALGERRGGLTLVDSMRGQLLAAIERERAGTTRPDGWPSAIGPGGDAARRQLPSPAERAAERRAAGAYEPDRHRQLTLGAIEALGSAVAAVWSLRCRLDALEALRGTQAPIRQTCAACTGLRRLTGDKLVHRRSAVGDRLPAPVGLCRSCYGYVERSFEAGSRSGRIPTAAEVRNHDERGTWAIRQATGVDH